MNGLLFPTLADAKKQVQDHLDEGIACPCCGQYAKRYRRKLNTVMARGLIWLVRAAGPELEWVEYSSTGPSWLIRTNQLSTLKYWGLVESKPNEDPAKKCSGVWRPTSRGVYFARGSTTEPTHVHVFNDKAEGWSQERGDIRAALGEKFNYDELMNGEHYG